MAFIWKGLCSVASTAWKFAEPLVKSITGATLQQAGSSIAGGSTSQQLDALGDEKKMLTNEIHHMEKKYESLEKDFQSKRHVFSEKERDLEATAERLMREQEKLRRAEEELEDRQKRSVQSQEVAVRGNHEVVAKQVAKVRKYLSKELQRYEEGQTSLLEDRRESDREYAEHRKRLEEKLEILRKNQSEIIHLMKTLPAIQKVKELHALTDNFMHNCKVYSEDPEAMVEETRLMQRQYQHKLMEVRNVMLEGHLFPGSMRVWADAAVLDLHMLGFLVSQELFSHRTVEIAKELYQGYWDDLKIAHQKHAPVGESSGKLAEIEHLLGTQFRSFDSLMIQSVSSKALPALGPGLGQAFQSSSYRVSGFSRHQSSRCSGSLRNDRRRPPANGWELARPRESAPSRDKVRRQPSANGWELARPGDSAPSRDKVRRLQILEKELASLKLEVDRDDRGSWNNDLDSGEEDQGASRMTAVVPSSKGSAQSLVGRTLEQGRRVKQRYSHGYRQAHGSSSPRGHKERYQERLTPTEDFEVSSEGSSEEEEEEESYHEPKGRDHLSRDKRMNRGGRHAPDEQVKLKEGRHLAGKEPRHAGNGRHLAGNEEKDDESASDDSSDGSLNGNFATIQTSEVLRESHGRKSTKEFELHHSSTKKKSSEKKRYSTRDLK